MRFLGASACAYNILETEITDIANAYKVQRYAVCLWVHRQKSDATSLHAVRNNKSRANAVIIPLYYMFHSRGFVHAKPCVRWKKAPSGATSEK